MVVPRVILVDDDAQFLRVFLRLWGEEGFTEPVSMFTNGAQAALALGMSREPTLLVTDLHMPKYSGLQLLQWLHHQPHLKNVWVAVLTGSEEAIDEVWCRYLKVNGYFRKSADIAGLRATIRDIHAQLALVHH